MRYNASMPPIEPNIPETFADLSHLPYLTADLPGIGGVLKHEPEDFIVEEIPAYAPSGTGEHLFLSIEKRDTAAEALTRHIADTLGIKSHDVGVAGLKDRRAVTRQFVSVPAQFEPQVSQLNTEHIRVLSAEKHQNKLRSGHCQGNRFTIVVREANVLAAAQAIADRLISQGVPNYFGDQRFGRNAETLTLGLDLLSQRTKPRKLPAARRKFLLRLSLSAVQSALFNRALADRLANGQLQQVAAGDVMQVVQTGGCFVVEDVPTEQDRFVARETVPTGPMFGPKMKAPTGAVAEIEHELLKQFGLDSSHFGLFPKLTRGTRRPYLFFVNDLLVQPHPSGLQFEFTLPSGCYATVLMDEFMKTSQ